MAFDGITVAALVEEMNRKILGGKIAKIAQPESDEILLTIKNQGNTYRLFLSASAGLPLVYFTENNKTSPPTAPNFCMVLRKHIGNGKIVSITQPGLERIIMVTVEHLDEMGDLGTKRLIIELMGKHSNIIFCRDDDTIIDSIRHVSSHMSSLREVFPGRPYFIPEELQKADPLQETPESLAKKLSGNVTATKFLNRNYSGISYSFAESLALLCGIDTSVPIDELSDEECYHFSVQFCRQMEEIAQGNFEPELCIKDGNTIDFSARNLVHDPDCEYEDYDSISQLLEDFYSRRNKEARIKQKSADLRKIVQTHLERSRKKLDLQEKQLKDTEKRNQYKLYGELLMTYGYSASPGDNSLTATDYYTGKEVTIPLDPTKTAMENAQKYYDRYNKLKRTFEAVTEQLSETENDIRHLESIQTALELSLEPEDLTEIKQELVQSGYMKHHAPLKKGKKEKILSKPYHYRSSDGFDIYVGKNNFQNEELTFRFAEGGDWWFHAKGVPGSHVILKSGGKEVPDTTFEEAGALAAFYSRNRDNEKVEIDYIEKKHVKKPSGGKPGFVVYYTNYSLIASPNIGTIEKL